MKLVKMFFVQNKGSLLQVIIAFIIVGTMSYHFWTEWGSSMYNAGSVIKDRLESEHWLNE